MGPKLKAQQQLSTNEWRAHVDQTVANNQHIEKVLEETQSDLQTMNKYVCDSDSTHHFFSKKYALNCYLNFILCCVLFRSFSDSFFSFFRRTVSDDLNRMRTKEKYMNNQYSALCAEYQQVRKDDLVIGNTCIDRRRVLFTLICERAKPHNLQIFAVVNAWSNE